MIPADVLRALRNDLPMPVTIRYLGRDGPYGKMSEGFFRFACPHCHEVRATVNPKNNLAISAPLISCLTPACQVSGPGGWLGKSAREQFLSEKVFSPVFFTNDQCQLRWSRSGLL